MQYFKPIEKSIDSGLNELIQTDLYRIGSEGNALNFELSAIQDKPVKAKALIPQNLDNLILDTRLGLLGQPQKTNNELLFPALYYNKKEEGQMEKYVVK